MNPRPIPFQIPRKTSVQLHPSATQQNSLSLRVPNAKSMLKSHFYTEFFNIPDVQEGMFDDSNSFLCFLSNYIIPARTSRSCTTHPHRAIADQGILPTFFHLFTSHVCPIHLDVSGADTSPPPSQIKSENYRFKASEDWVLSHGLLFSNGKTTKNDVAYFCTKHICINYVLLTNGHAIRIFRGKCNVSPMIIFNIFCFPSISLLKLWHNN